MSHNPVGWFEIYVADMTRARTFYQTLFELELSPLCDGSQGPEMWAFPKNMHSYGITGALVKMDGVPVGANSTIVYFHSQDCRIPQSRVLQAGGQIVRECFSIGEHGFIALVKDTEGNIIGLHSMQ